MLTRLISLNSPLLIKCAFFSFTYERLDSLVTKMHWVQPSWECITWDSKLYYLRPRNAISSGFCHKSTSLVKHIILLFLLILLSNTHFVINCSLITNHHAQEFGIWHEPNLDILSILPLVISRSHFLPKNFQFVKNYTIDFCNLKFKCLLRALSTFWRDFILSIDLDNELVKYAIVSIYFRKKLP